MKKIIQHSILLFLLFIGLNGKACTTFCINDSINLIFGRNFDFSTGFGHVIINKRNMKKSALIQPPEKRIEWISKYGSVTFNQSGREFPYGGINEKGLVIEQMWLDKTTYPEIDNRYGLTELQWIQYQLDNSETVDELIASDTLLRISKLSVAPLHFLVCDRFGNIATIEYLNGKMICHTQSSLPIRVLANDSYESSIAYIKSFRDFGGTDSIPNTTRSLDRFAKAASMIKQYENKNVIDYSFDILSSISQGGATHWSIVYDIKNMTVYYKTFKNKTIRQFNVSDIDFSCDSPSLYIDIDDSMANDKLNFKIYSYKTNRELIDNLCNNVRFLETMPEEAREITAKYPETTKCNK